MGLKKINFVAIVLLIASSSCKENKTAQEKIADTTQWVSETSESPSRVLLLKLMTNAKNVFYQESLPCKESFSYIGQLKDNAGNVYTIANYSFEWGANCKLTTRILIYTEKAKYLGNYYTQGILPSQIIDNQLYFDGGEKVSFTNEMPQKLQLSDISFDFEPAEF